MYEVNSLGGASLALGGFLWQTRTQRTVELNSRQTVLGVLLRRASAALRGRVQSLKGAKLLGIEDSRVSKDLPCLSHTYLTRDFFNWFRPGLGYPKSYKLKQGYL